MQIYCVGYGMGKALNTGRLQILEGYSLKEDILRNGREWKGEREGSSRIFGKGKDLKLVRKRERKTRKERALHQSSPSKKKNK